MFKFQSKMLDLHDVDFLMLFSFSLESIGCWKTCRRRNNPKGILVAMTLARFDLFWCRPSFLSSIHLEHYLLLHTQYVTLVLLHLTIKTKSSNKQTHTQEKRKSNVFILLTVPLFFFYSNSNHLCFNDHGYFILLSKCFDGSFLLVSWNVGPIILLEHLFLEITLKNKESVFRGVLFIDVF